MNPEVRLAPIPLGTFSQLIDLLKIAVLCYQNTFSSVSFLFYCSAPRWQNATIEGLMRALTDIHDVIRVTALITCATAVLERPRLDSDSQESGERSLI